MKNQRQFETVRVSSVTEKIMQTVVCSVSAIVALFAAIEVANSIHDHRYPFAIAWAVVMVMGFSIFFRYVVDWGVVKVK